MNKEGHIGVVKSTEKPIVKGALKYLAQGKLNDSLDASSGAINSGNGGGRNGEVVPKSRRSHMSSNAGGYLQGGMQTLPLHAAAEQLTQG